MSKKSGCWGVLKIATVKVVVVCFLVSCSESKIDTTDKTVILIRNATTFYYNNTLNYVKSLLERTPFKVADLPTNTTCPSLGYKEEIVSKHVSIPEGTTRVYKNASGYECYDIMHLGSVMGDVNKMVFF